MRSRWMPLALVVALVGCTLATAALYARSQPDVYTSRAVLSLSPRDPAKVGADNLELAASRYSAMLSSPAVLSDVARQVGESSRTVSHATRVSVQPNTVNIAVVVTMREAKQASAIANALASAALAASRDDELVTADLTVPAVVPSSPSGPQRKLIMLGGLGVAVVLGIGAVALLGYFRNSPALSGEIPTKLPARVPPGVRGSARVAPAVYGRDADDAGLAIIRQDEQRTMLLPEVSEEESKRSDEPRLSTSEPDSAGVAHAGGDSVDGQKQGTQ